MSQAAGGLVNALTRRWLGRQGGGGGTVLSALGVWPLLAHLAAAANEPGRSEMLTAIGLASGSSDSSGSSNFSDSFDSSGSSESAAGAARDLLAVTAAIPAVRLALGLWTAQDLPLHEAWLATLPPDSAGTFSGDRAADQRRLDEWADRTTGGLIKQFPLTVGDEIRLILASALLVETTWIQPFWVSSHRVTSGPWALPATDEWEPGRSITALHRSTAVLDRLAVTGTPLGPLTHLTVMGTDDIDVHLVLGPESGSPGEILAVGVDVVGRAFPALTGDRLPYGTPGPGVTVGQVRSFDRHDRLHVTTVPFEVTAEHDLLALADVFGLTTVTDLRRGHFPGISTDPLAVGAARQNAMARFTDKGFKAAAVTAFGAVAAGIPPTPPFRVKSVSVVFDRPFAFYAVHRRTGLILVAGWVAEPAGAEPTPWG